MRKCGLPDVIEKMIAVIPMGNDSLLAKLESTKQSALFAAPEMQSYWWKRCQRILESLVLPIDADWKNKVADIFYTTEL
mgnify:CR=1 FL=1